MSVVSEPFTDSLESIRVPHTLLEDALGYVTSLVGLGLLVIFRHGASLGGFNVLALLLQERLNFRAGYVQMGLDVSVILLALFVVAPATVLLSAVGAVVLNIILAFNHRPGRYLA
jgi:uncharacterized membrane-anchored protein YitT (DUF2179 family)